eukprot:TRINITY_DN59128_c0_g1_i1.p1 TRINITY_DN59128_c0_g1~~TRINITY_DN59128_c0_g1_i1.p1  ORF type:complete len:349 (-),score=34.54 TRINITY_DN59128_c0_g1_i1:179-1225(-)
MLQGSSWNYLRLGAKMDWWESVLVYGLPFVMHQSETLQGALTTNALRQIALFVPVVQLPALFTGHMSYVDIGWPCGLVTLAATGLQLGTGYWLRKYVVCGCMLLHGLRMASGALYLFFPYVWPQDLPRYQYAKVRWLQKDGMPESGWWLKVQHDTLQQAFANATVLAAPIMLCAFDTRESIHPVEVIGWATWVLAWLWECIADGQKLQFVADCKKLHRQGTPAKDAVLGYAPFDGRQYCLWTMSRHPNYFGEWMCWNGFMISALPSLFYMSETPLVKAAFGLALVYCSRLFYDCLCFWTGAEPAEHFSVKKRPLYKQYQEQVNVFFPFAMPGVDHCRRAGWPFCSDGA